MRGVNALELHSRVRTVLPLWQDRLSKMSGLPLGLKLSVPSRVQCWGVGTARDGRTFWLGISRPHAVTLAAGALAWPRTRVAAHLYGRDDHVLLRDAFGEICNVAVAALDEALAEPEGRPGLRFTEASLWRDPPATPSILACRLTIPRMSPGSLMLHAA